MLLLCVTTGTGLPAASVRVVPGLEVLLGEKLSLIQGKRIGLITNHTGIDHQARHAIDLLRSAPGVQLTALFAPEHGIRGMVQAGGKVVDIRDERSGVPVYSIYGRNSRPTAEMLANVDVLVYDIQDAGVRFYTFISSLGECMQSAADKGIPFIVLDRPNPITATRVEGPVLDLRFKSFVGAYPVPIRYGWTVGELAGFIQTQLTKPVPLTVVKMKNYYRSLWYDQTGLPWVAPSPNLPSVAAAEVYPGMCLFEGTNVSEGRGTTQPFEMVGAPWIDSYRLADELAPLNLPGVLFRPAAFTPTFSKYEGEACQGIQLHVTDRNRFEPVRAALQLLTDIRKNHPTQFQWRAESFDRLCGTDTVRKALEQGIPVDKIVDSWQPGLSQFGAVRQRYFLYPE